MSESDNHPSDPGSGVIDPATSGRSLADRREVFYWQTDRAVDPAEAGRIWADRHRYFGDDLIGDVNAALDPADPLDSLVAHDPSAQLDLGNVNSVRRGNLRSGRPVIVRCHPRGIPNGYFHAESAATDAARALGVPTYETLAVHDFAGGDDFAFQVISALPGTAVSRWLKSHPDDEAGLLAEMGAAMARLHHVEVNGFGPLDNQAARRGELVGLHRTYVSALRAALEWNLAVLVRSDILTGAQAAAVDALYREGNPALACERAVLVHNDFAEWNLLTDGSTITGVLDFDEAVGGDPVGDLACWSTFYEPGRLGQFLRGYREVGVLPDDYAERFELLRLRYTVSKMVLRTRKYSWDPSPFVAEKIEVGRAHLAESFSTLGIPT